MPHKTITIHITDQPGGGISVLTTAGTPLPGRGLTPAEALATDLLSCCTRRASDMRYWQGKDRALALLGEMLEPEDLGYQVSAEVRRRVCDVLGRVQGIPA